MRAAAANPVAICWASAVSRAAAASRSRIARRTLRLATLGEQVQLHGARVIQAIDPAASSWAASGSDSASASVGRPAAAR